MRKNKKNIYIIDRQIILIRRCSTIGKQSVIETDRQTDRQTERETDGKTWIDRNTDRQTDTQTI